MSYLDKYAVIKGRPMSPFGERVMAEIGYAHKLSKAKGGRFDEVISRAVDFMSEKINVEGIITDAVAAKAESILSVLSEEAKKYKIMCVAHAHIDMNWMWDYPETVAITTETFRTVLGLMKDFPEFKFSQSQASVYRIVEENDPQLLDEIRRMVVKGRWEAVASTWVEADKNMTSGESQARHVLYTKRYLEKLLGISPDSIQIDFEPDTFGHSANVPEILTQGGIRFYYHCRGYDGHNIYRWKSASGASLLVYREPVWYNEQIDSDMALFVPEFCDANGIDTLLKVYGVGDHGGGPTRRDLELITEMQKWPVFPEITFGTYAEFFRLLNSRKEEYPEVTGELNFVFTGCYTSQSRIKKANKTLENRLYDSEVLSSMAAIENTRHYTPGKFFGAWEKVLFNQFHDILPGSGVIDTREFAMGNYQYALAAANSEASGAMRTMAETIDTSWVPKLETTDCRTISEGAGVGFGLDRHKLPETETGRGINRIRHIFNPTQFTRNEPVETTLWDWQGDLERLIVTDHEGNLVPHQLIDKKTVHYWAHDYVRLLIHAEIPPFGYSTYCITQSEMKDIPVSLPNWERLMDKDSYILENDRIRAELDPCSLVLKSLHDKDGGNELVDPKGTGGCFNLVDEDTTKGMSSWVVGRYKKVTPICENLVVTERHINTDAVRQWISYKGNFGNSSLRVTVSLDKGSNVLVYDTECDWHEKAEHKVTVQQLNYSIALSQSYDKYVYDIPMGTVERPSLGHDVPGLSYVAAVNDRGGVMLVSPDRYGFRGNDDSLSITLVRNSTNPDPYPESGIIRFRFGIASARETGNFNLQEAGIKFLHAPVVVSGLVREGNMEPRASLFGISNGNVCVSAVKMAEEDPKDMIVRVYEPTGCDQEIIMTFKKTPVRACFTDINETEESDNLPVSGNAVMFGVEAAATRTIRIIF